MATWPATEAELVTGQLHLAGTTLPAAPLEARRAAREARPWPKGGCGRNW